MAGRGAALAAAFDSAARQRQRQQFMGMNAFDRHRKLVHDLVAYYGAQLPAGGQVRATAPGETCHAQHAALTWLL